MSSTTFHPNDIPYAIAKDAANASMRSAGRTRWNDDDRDVFTREYHRVFPCPDDVECELCGAGK